MLGMVRPFLGYIGVLDAENNTMGHFIDRRFETHNFITRTAKVEHLAE
jgi:hypothetical protein